MNKILAFIGRLILAFAIGIVLFLTLGEIVRVGLLDAGASTMVAGLGKLSTFVLGAIIVEQVAKRVTT